MRLTSTLWHESVEAAHISVEWRMEVASGVFDIEHQSFIIIINTFCTFNALT